MSTCWVTLVPTETATRVLLMQGQDEILRAMLPPFSKVQNESSVARFLEALSLWLDCRLCVALHADDSADLFRLDLQDELGNGARSVFYAVEPLPRAGRPRPRRLKGVGDFKEMRQLWLWASSAGATP